DDDRAPPVDLEKRLHVLEEIELFVLRRGPEVGTLIGHVLLLDLAALSDDGDARLPPEGRVREDDAVALARLTREGVDPGSDRARIGVDAVEEEVHDRETRRVRNEIASMHEGLAHVA